MRQNCVNLCCCCFTFHISLPSGRPPPSSGRRRLGPRTTLPQSARPSIPPPRVAVSNVVWRPLGVVVGLGCQPPVPWVGFLRSVQESLSNPLLHREERPTRVTTGVWRKDTQTPESPLNWQLASYYRSNKVWDFMGSMMIGSIPVLCVSFCHHLF